MRFNRAAERVRWFSSSVARVKDSGEAFWRGFGLHTMAPSPYAAVSLAALTLSNRLAVAPDNYFRVWNQDKEYLQAVKASAATAFPAYSLQELKAGALFQTEAQPRLEVHDSRLALLSGATETAKHLGMLGLRRGKRSGLRVAQQYAFAC
jgi:hypothetical protein